MKKREHQVFDNVYAKLKELLEEEPKEYIERRMYKLNETNKRIRNDLNELLDEAEYDHRFRSESFRRFCEYFDVPWRVKKGQKNERYSNFPRYNYYDKVDELTKDFKNKDDYWFVSLRGSHGSGKSSIPLTMIQEDDGAFVLTLNDLEGAKTDYERSVMTVFPKFNTIVLGRYSATSGGMDSIPKIENKQRVIELASKLPYNIITEGAMDSEIYTKYLDTYKNMVESGREVIILGLIPPLEVVKERFINRRRKRESELGIETNNAMIRTDNVEKKWRSVQKYIKKFEESGFNTITVDNSDVDLKEVLPWFFNLVDSSRSKK